MKVTEIAFTVYPVTDLKRAREFYEGTFGLVKSRSFGGEAEGFVEYDLGEGTFAIGCGPEQFKPGSGGGTIALEVEDFEAAISRLKDRSCGFLVEPMETPVCQMAIITDSEGNAVIVHKRKAAEPSSGGEAPEPFPGPQDTPFPAPPEP